MGGSSSGHWGDHEKRQVIAVSVTSELYNAAVWRATLVVVLPAGQR